MLPMCPVLDFHIDLGKIRFPWFRKKPRAVLVVDDDNVTLQLVRRAAEAKGFEIETAETAEEAIGILRRNGRQFVLAMVDVKLPLMSGWELRAELVRLWPRLPVVIMSGAPESFMNMPHGERLTILIKPAHYGEFFGEL